MSPTLTAARLTPHLEAWLASGGSGRTFVVHLDGSWSGGEQLIVDGGEYVDVRVCPSELAVREELARARPEPRTRVLLSSAEIQGADVLARIAKRRVLRLHAWDAVQHLFGVRQIDPRLLREKWMAEALVEAAPAGGYERTAAQGLDADRAWRELLCHRYGIDAGAGLRGLLHWAAGTDTARLTGRGERERAATGARLCETVEGCAPVLAAVEAGRGGSVLALGLVVRALLDGPAGEARATARTLLGVQLGGWAFDDRQARAWATAAEDQVLALLAGDAPAGQAALQAADGAVGALRAQPLVGVSDLLATALRARLQDLGAALSRRRAGAGAAGAAGAEAGPEPAKAGLEAGRARAREIEAAADHVRRHRLRDHHELAGMVTRLVRWLQAPVVQHDGLRAAAEAHVAEECYADWARTALRVATGEAALDEQLRALVAEADARRRAQDVAFAARLASYVGHAAPGGLVLGVEEVLDRVVAPIAAERPVLLLVLDGMSHRVASELLEDVVQRGWVELRPPAQTTRTLVLSALPSVTQFSRASLLSGTLVKGTAPNEAKAFAAHDALVAAGRRGPPPLLFHKGALADPHGGLAAQVRSELAGDRRVLGAVVNAIDDHLARSDQLATPWSATYVPLLRLLLDEARDAGRIVVLASDHGHVLDHGGVHRDGGPDHGERYRTAAQPAGDGEQLVEGARVLLQGGRCVLAADERVRYAPRKHGYHGGTSPQEVLAPLLVLAPGLAEDVDGWVETPYDAPAWWTGQPPAAAPGAPAAPAVRRRAHPAAKEAAGQLTLGGDVSAPVVGPAPGPAAAPGTAAAPGLVTAPTPAAAPGWIAELLASEGFVASRGGGPGRGRVPEERVVAILSALAGGKLLLDALARQVGIAPLRLTGTLAAMRQLLNVDGYPVLTVDEDTGDVTLDVALLCEQFGLPSR